MKFAAGVAHSSFQAAPLPLFVVVLYVFVAVAVTVFVILLLFCCGIDYIFLQQLKVATRRQHSALAQLLLPSLIRSKTETKKDKLKRKNVFN